MNILNLPVFPLPVFLLPNGITRLRIFEPRYLKLVKIATQGQGFVITPNDDINNNNAIWGSWVSIINFDQGDDGVLEIDIKSHSLVTISSLEKDEDNLLFGDISTKEHWSEKEGSLKPLDEGSSEHSKEVDKLSTSLGTLFKNDHRLGNLYQEKPLDNRYWVVARWLELLPLPIDVKTKFISTHSYSEAKNIVQSILFK